METFDYVIIGAGSAGSVLANRAQRRRGTASACSRPAPATGIPTSICRRLHQDLPHEERQLGSTSRRSGDWTGGRSIHAAARQDAGRLLLDQRPHLQPRPAPGFRHLGPARQSRLGLSRRAALFQADGAAGRRGRGYVPRPRRRAHRHRHRLARSALRGLHRRRGEPRHPAKTPTTTAASRRASPTPSAPSRTAGASAPRPRSCARR